MFLRNYWYVAGRSDEVGRVLLQRWILNEPVLLYRTEGGTAVAMQGNCPHRSLPLSKGRLIEDEVECGYHGLKFAPSGECTHVPALDKVPATCRVKTYPVVEMNRWVWIWMGDPALADEATIPDCRWNDDPEWSVTEGHLEIGCNYALLVDNLLDLSHTAFVHRDSIGDRSVAEAPANTEVSGNSVSVIRRLKNVPPPPYFVKLHGWNGNIDRSQHIQWTPPTFVHIVSWTAPVGTDKSDNSNALVYRVLNGITPATERQVHHFWSIPRNFAHGAEVDDQQQEENTRILTQDIAILEAQQEMVNRLSGTPDSLEEWVNIPADAGAIRARRIVAALREQGHQAQF